MKQVHLTTGNTEYSTDDLIDPSLVVATDNAYHSGRSLAGSSDAGWDAEYREPAVLPDGRKCDRVYLFTNDEMQDEHGEPLDEEDYPWDDEHVARIVLDY